MRDEYQLYYVIGDSQGFSTSLFVVAKDGDMAVRRTALHYELIDEDDHPTEPVQDDYDDAIGFEEIEIVGPAKGPARAIGWEEVRQLVLTGVQ